jgi:hypothetical protein
LLCDVKSHTALVIAYYSFVMYCYVMSSLTPPFINVKSHNSICPQHGSIASQLPLIILYIYIYVCIESCVKL